MPASVKSASNLADHESWRARPTPRDTPGLPQAPGVRGYKFSVRYTHKKIISRVRNTLSLSNFLYVQRRVKSLNEKNTFLKWQYAICFSNLSRNLLIDTVDIESDLK